MKFTDIIWTPKMHAVMADDSQILFLGGATGTSKTLIAGHKVMDWMLNAPADQTQFYLIFKDIGTGVRNILDNKDSFYNMFPFMREEYGKSAGGMQFVFKGVHSNKIVYFLGADNKASWGKILGSNPDGLWLEELSELHIDCVREAFGRAISRRCKLIATTNGGLPSQEFYTEYLNYSEVQFADKVPAIELEEMWEFNDGGKHLNKVKRHYHYYHFNLEDDSPHLSEEDREKLIELYPQNSFYYNSKVLGCRGFVEGAAYALFMKREIHLRDYDDVNLNYLKEIVLIVDMGSNRNATDEKKTSTIAKLVGYSKDYQRMIVLERWLIPAKSHDFIINEVEKHIEPYWVKYMEKFTDIYVDNADGIIVNTWAEKNKYPTIRINPAVKSTKGEAGINLISRCTFKQQLIKQERLIWSSRATASYNAHTRVLLDEDGSVLDLHVQDNDDNDCVDYAITARWGLLVRQDRRKYGS